MSSDTTPANDFLFDLLAGIGAPADPALDTYYAALFAYRDAVHYVSMARGGLAVAIARYGYGRSSDEAAALLRAAERHLDATPHPGPLPA